MGCASSEPEDNASHPHSEMASGYNHNRQREINPDISYGTDETDLIETLLISCGNNTLIDRLLGCAYGQALGDAYGLSTEFETFERIAKNYPNRSKVIPFPDYKLTGHSCRWVQGDWTDDTDQWILILETILESSADEKIFARKLKDWIRHGFPVLGDQGGMGLGANVSQVVSRPDYLDDPIETSRLVWETGNRKAAPNGAVMRCSAVALVYYNDRERLKSTTISMCKTTHCDPRCIASCLAVCLVVAELINKNVDDGSIESIVRKSQEETIRILGNDFPQDQIEAFLWHTNVSRTLDDLKLDEHGKIGYTYKCLASGFYGLRSKLSFKQTLNDLIRHGGDADTNGAVCGTMYGARYGYSKLPAEWLRAMPYKKWFDKKIISYLRQMKVIENKTISTPL
ncbi:unnamed protein product [Adineta ricciae]|uniref:ADP-ribosylglycohydrolase n=1 Tax=Adineta ricciae TaxID=249248 RepID=A0A814YCR8_ADIRI|nr:unnamed protein product [Adineta ricciae]